MVDAGIITAAEALTHPRANIITRAVGADVAELELDKATGSLRPGDRFLLCSDGLSKCVPEADLAALLAAADPAADHFLAAALDRHADDNVTAVTIEVPGASAAKIGQTVRLRFDTKPG